VTNNGVAEAIAFDLNGNETSVVTATSTNSYQWDAANRLVSITGPTNQSFFTYDGLGRRVQIIEMTNGVAYMTNKFIWDGVQLVEQRDVTGSIVMKRFFGEGEQISGVNYFFTRDHLGSVREVINAAGVMQARYDYDSYGRSTIIAGSLNADFGYAGMYYHTASGLNLTLYRAYDSDWGRWLSRDPLAEGAGLNLYTYVDNNPLNAVDSDGREAFLVTIVVIGLVSVGTLLIYDHFYYKPGQQANQASQTVDDTSGYQDGNADAIRAGTSQQLAPQGAGLLDQTQNGTLLDTILKTLLPFLYLPNQNPTPQNNPGHWVTVTIYTWQCNNSTRTTTNPASPGPGWKLMGIKSFGYYDAGP
jgi:RHS repeat-associated protein